MLLFLFYCLWHAMLAKIIRTQSLTSENPLAVVRQNPMTHILRRFYANRSHVEGHRGGSTVNRNDLWEATLGLHFTQQLTRLEAAWSGVSMGQGPGHHCSDFPAISSLHPSMPSPTRFKSRPYFMLLWQAFLDFPSWVRGPSDSHLGVLKLSVSLSLPLDCGPPEGKDHVSIVPVLSTLTGKGGVFDIC